MTGTAVVYWLTQSLADVPDGCDGDWLNGGELAKLEELHYLKRRADWRLGRWTAKRAVGLLMEREGRTPDPHRVEIVTANDGAPDVHFDGELADVSVSLSHSGGLGFCVVMSGRVPIGCDVEIIEPRSDQFVSDYFTRREADAVRQAPEPDRPKMATLIWSAKESALKAMRIGLDRDTRSVEVAAENVASPGAWQRLQVRCRETETTFLGWCRQEGDRVFTYMSVSKTGPPIPLVKQSFNSA
jgi:4'-phosphopantetheinyl transferase